jgi:hypothetical protein
MTIVACEALETQPGATAIPGQALAMGGHWHAAAQSLPDK